MRRPLAAAALTFVAAVWLITCLRPLPVPEPDREDGRRGAYAGTVSDIVCYTDTRTGEQVRLVYLKDAAGKDLQPDKAYPSKKVLSEHPQKSTDHIYSEQSYFQIICRLEAESPLPRIGSRVMCEGEVSWFREAANPGEFNAKEYYNRQGYAFELRDAVVTGAGRSYSRYRQALWLLKNHMGDALEALLSEEDASVMKAMLLGEKKGMDQEIKALYQAAGISHVVAISGLHISILGMGLYNLLSRFCGKRISCAISGFFLLSFLFMTGFSASSMRAGIMFAFSLAARLLGRTYDTATALAVAAALLLVENPTWLFDTGFQLSFMAAFAASAAVPVFSGMDSLKDWLLKRRAGGNGKRYRERRGIGRKKRLFCKADWMERMKQGFSSSFCISMVTLPLVLSSFYEWNVLSVVVNLAVIPLMGALLGGCILLAVLGSLFLLFGETGIGWLAPVALPVRAILLLYKTLCRVGSAGGIGLFRPGAPQPWQILLFYAGLGLVFLAAGHLPKIAGYGSCALLCLVFVAGKPAGTQLTMLDVGQGDCIHIRSQTGRHYLCDGGSTSKMQTGTWQVIPYLKHQGVNRLELIFISHCDADHINAVEEVLDWAGEGKLEVGGLVLPAAAPDDEKKDALVRAAAENKVPVYAMKAGDILSYEGTCFQALYPTLGEGISDRNAASLVLRFSEKNGEGEIFSALLTGDVEASGEEQILRERRELASDCTVLKTAHHGSDTSTTQAFLDAVSPRAALISCGKDNSYGHPHQEVLERFEEAGIPVFITARCGAVTVRAKGDGILVETFLKEEN